MNSPGAGLAGGLDRGTMEDKGKNQKIILGTRDLDVVGNAEIGGYAIGETGAKLTEVVRHCENQLGGYGLVDEAFLAELHVDHNKITDLMRRLGETRDEVSIVARTAGGFTRMFLRKEADGHYKEVTEKENSRDKTKTHRQESDLFILERGIRAGAA